MFVLALVSVTFINVLVPEPCFAAPRRGRGVLRSASRSVTLVTQKTRHGSLNHILFRENQSKDYEAQSLGCRLESLLR